MNKSMKSLLLSLILITALTTTVFAGLQLTGDLNSDYKVDFKDLRILAWDWLDPACFITVCTADLDDVEGVNMADLALLAQNWHKKCPPMVISEFMAINEYALSTTVEGKQIYPDWIEIYNQTAEAVDLDDWYLTDREDELTKWEFPDISLASGNYLRVFASGIPSEDHPQNNPYIDEQGFYHTNFVLDGDGEYLALVCPSLEVVHEYKSYENEQDNYGFPPQGEDVSYGLYMDEPRYFTSPTPGYSNNQGLVGMSDSLWFSHQGGTFVDPFSLVLTPKTPGAVIRYTTNGSIPTETSTQYTGPITISDTTEIMARAYESGNAPSIVVSRTYIALASDVQSFNSDIPIVIVDTYGVGIGESAYTKSSAVFIERILGRRVNITDPADFAGRCGLKIRGQTNKRQFSFETWDKYDQDKEVSILGLPADSDWVLYGPGGFDQALINNPLAHELSNQIGQYAVRTRACEVYINTGGGKVAQSDYWGLAYFMEKIRINKDRIDIATLEPWDSTEPKVSGGYVIAVDKDGTWRTTRGTPAYYCAFAYIDPPGYELTSTQKNWLLNWLDEFEDVVFGPNFADPQDGYAKYIDVASHVDHNMLNMLTMNVDGLRISAYMYKDRQGKLVAGPVWDFDRSLESTDGRDDNPEAWNGTGDATDYFESSTQYTWWHRFFSDINFWQKYIDRWYQLRRGPFSTESIDSTIDMLANEIEEAQARHYAKWGESPRFGSFQGEIDNMKDWLATRSTWIDNQFVKPPQITPYGGYVEAGTTVSISNPNGSGTIWYTIDGNDPRLPEELKITGTTLVVEDAPKKVLVPGGPINDNWKGGGAFDDSGWNHGTPIIPGKTGGVGYDETPDYLPYISYDVEALMNADVNPGATNSCYIRIPFTFNGDPCNFNFMTLYIRYDDGFIAYLNGDEIERINFPDDQTPQWNSNASNGHDTTGLESISVSDHLGSLRNGDNILAIHGLNISNTSSDFIISAELVVGEANSTEGISPSAMQYSGPITLNESTQIKARVLVGSNPYSPWSGLADPTYGIGPVAESLRITEIMYHPVDTNDPNDPNTEFIELKNIGQSTVNLNLVKFTEGIHFTFPNNELEPGECIVVVEDQNAFEDKYGTSVKTAGRYTGRLANNGERIRLQDAAGQLILDFEYKDGWYPITDGDNFSLTVIDPCDSSIYGSEEGLVAHWKFDDGSGTTAVDSAGNNDGTLNGNPNWVAGMINGALSFDGVDDYVVAAPIASLMGDTLTMQTWVRTSEHAGLWNPVLTQNAGGDGYYFYVSSGRPVFYIVAGATYVQVISPDVINPDEWYHVAGTNDGSNLKLYIDGRIKDSENSNGFLGANSNAYIGFEPSASLYYYGLIDDVRIYDRAVSESEFQDMANPMERWSRKSSWRPSVYRNGTPGWDDSGNLPNPGAVVINEVMAHSNAGPDWIELHNTTDETINIGGWFLSDNNKDEPNLTKYRIADGTTIPGNDYVVFYQDTDFNNLADPGCLIPFALSENGEEACLSSHLDPNGYLTGYREVEDFGASQTNVSIGRYYKSSTGNFNFVAMDYNTPDSNNAYPKVGPVVINEIMYNPPSGNQNEEYIELHNITGTLVTLYRHDKLTPWKFTDGIDYTFSASPVVTIPAYGYLILAKDLTAFTARYGGVPIDVQVLEGYDGRLSNGGEKLQIDMPGDIDELGIRYYIRIDRVNYSDGLHPENCPGGVDLWPREADGLGKSLSRKVSADYGNDVANWKAATPSPGTVNP